MEFGMHKDRYEKLKETINNIFEGTTEELNELVESYDTTLKEKNIEIAEVWIYIMIVFLYTPHIGLLFLE